MIFASPEVRAFVFGLIVASAVGPIALLFATNSLRFGMTVGIESALGAALGDLTYAIVALAAGAAVAPALTAHSAALRVAGALVLVGFGLYMIFQARKAHLSDDGAPFPPARPRFGALPTTYLLTVVNPLTIIVFVGFIAQLPVGLPYLRLAAVALSLFAGSLVVQLSLALAGSTMRRWLQDDHWVRRINVASGVGIIVFGLLGLVQRTSA